MNIIINIFFFFFLIQLNEEKKEEEHVDNIQLNEEKKEENIDNNIQLNQEKKEEENIENNIQLSQEKKEEHIENDFEKSEVKIITTQNETAISEAKVLTQENNLLSEENLDKNQFNISNEIKEIKGMPDEPFAQRDYIFNKKNIRVIKIEEEETQFCPDIFSPFMKKIFG